MTEIEATQKKASSLSLKGGLFTLTSLILPEQAWSDLADQLDEKIKQAPHFFYHAPLILDLQLLEHEEKSINFPKLIQQLKAKHLIPIGVRNVNQQQKEEAIQAGLAVFPKDKLNAPSVTPKNKMPSARASSCQGGTRLITTPIRSGQQIYVPEGDLIVLSSVSAGAEILADGHIHVYGTLRGRALAGIKGNVHAMIFCKHLEAELVSIAGQYRLSEDLKETYWKQAVRIHLEETRLNIHLL